MPRAWVDYDDRAWKRALRRTIDRVELRTVADLQRLAIRVQNDARTMVPVDTGRLRASIQHVMGEDARGPYADVGTNVQYAPFVEYGTQRQAAQPYMRPALLYAGEWWAQMARERR